MKVSSSSPMVVAGQAANARSETRGMGSHRMKFPAVVVVGVDLPAQRPGSCLPSLPGMARPMLRDPSIQLLVEVEEGFRPLLRIQLLELRSD